jgi:Tfp pilus assembly protein FimT
MKRVRVEKWAEMRRRCSAHQGMTLTEAIIAISLAAIILGAGLAAVNRYMSQRTLLGWSDIIVNDVRAAQQMSIARRAAVTVTFTAQAGANPASYTTTVGGGTIRSQTLPKELNFSAQTVQFSTLGVPTSGSAVTVTLTDSVISQSRTITVAPGTGGVSAKGRRTAAGRGNGGGMKPASA